MAYVNVFFRIYYIKACITNCQKCTAGTNCFKCDTGFFVNNINPSLSACSEKCPMGFYPDTVSGYCKRIFVDATTYIKNSMLEKLRSVYKWNNM